MPGTTLLTRGCGAFAHGEDQDGGAAAAALAVGLAAGPRCRYCQERPASELANDIQQDASGSNGAHKRAVRIKLATAA
jgi:hypothetical protein